MRRHLFFALLLTVIFLFAAENQSYYQKVAAYRALHPSNIKMEKVNSKIDIDILNLEINKNRVLARVANAPAEAAFLIGKKIYIYNRSIPADFDAQGHYSAEIDINRRQYRSVKNRDFDIDRHYYYAGIFAVYNTKKFIKRNNPGLMSHIYSARMRLRMFTGRVLGRAKSAGLLRAVWLGESAGYDGNERMKMLGINHLLVISGLHFSVIHRAMGRLTNIFGNRYIRAGFCILVMSLLLFTVNHSYSSKRAFYVVIYMEIGRMLGRENDTLMAQAFALGATLALEPYAVLSSSLHLSYYIYISISFVYRKVFSKAHPVVEIFRASIFIQFITMPIITHYFGGLNLYTFAANILAIPLFGMLVPASFLLIILGGIPVIGNLPVYLTDHIAYIFEMLIENLPIKNISLPGLGLDIVVAAFLLAVLIYVFKFLYKHRFIYLPAVFILMAVITAFSGPDKSAKIVFFDVGHGDAALISYGGINGMIDTGDGRLQLAPLLRKRGIKRLDFIIISHGHKDHHGGLREILQDMPVGAVYLNPPSAEKLGFIDPSIRRVVTEDSKLEFTKGNAKISVNLLYFEDPSDENNETILARAEMAGTLSYFLGDAGTKILDSIDFEDEIDLVKTAHHGSDTSLSARLYNGRKIGVNIVSCNHRHRLPKQAVIQQFERHDYKYYLTYTYGEIEFSAGKIRTLIPRKTIRWARGLN